MDSFDLQPEQKTRDTKSFVLNMLTVVILITILCAVVYFVMIFINPYSTLNLFPPPPQATLAAFPTATWTPRSLPATWTPTATIESTSTQTKIPTWTPMPSNTPFVVGTPGRKPVTSTPTQSVYSPDTPYTAVIYQTASSIYHPEAGCNWMGVAGQAMDKNGYPVISLTVHLGGMLGNTQIDMYNLTGTEPIFGQSGFEFFLGTSPIASNDTLWIQLLDTAGDPLTDVIYFDTSTSCSKNLVFIFFDEAD